MPRKEKMTEAALTHFQPWVLLKEMELVALILFSLFMELAYKVQVSPRDTNILLNIYVSFSENKINAARK